MRLISAVMSGQSANTASLSAEDLVKYCEEIAAASGGLLGIGKVSSEERKLLASIAPSHLVGLRDRAILAILIYTASRAGAVATLILVRDTRGSGRMDLVHGFASRRHPTLPPPTLQVTVEGK